MVKSKLGWLCAGVRRGRRKAVLEKMPVLCVGRGSPTTGPTLEVGDALLGHGASERRHYLPLLYCMGSTDERDRVSYPYEGFDFASISMPMIRFGEPKTVDLMRARYFPSPDERLRSG